MTDSIAVPTDAHADSSEQGPTHGVHMDCQAFWRPTAKALCGAECPWEDMVTRDYTDECVVCLDLTRCPVCGREVHA